MKKPLIRLPADDECSPIFNDIIDLVGADVAEKLQRVAGGTFVTIPRPKNLTQKSQLSLLVGFEDAKRIVDAVAPDSISIGGFTVPIGGNCSLNKLQRRVDDLLKEDGMSAREVAILAGVHIRTVWRRRSYLRSRGLQIGDSKKPRKHSSDPSAEIYGGKIVRTLLLEGHSPSQLRDILKVNGEVILTIRAALIREGKL